MRGFRLYLATFALTGFSSVALATGFKHKAGSEFWTEPTGASALSHVDLLTGEEYYGVQALKLWDFDRRACQLQIEQGSFNAPGSAVLESIKVCEPNLTQSWKRADIGAGSFVTAVSLCTAKSRDLVRPVRGVELRGASIGASGKLVPTKRPVRIEFTGCQKWSKPVACPAGSVATGVRGYTEDAQGVVGFALRCHAIEATE